MKHAVDWLIIMSVFAMVLIVFLLILQILDEFWDRSRQEQNEYLDRQTIAQHEDPDDWDSDDWDF